MNWQQILSAARTALSAGGPLSGLLIALGYTHTEELSKGVEALIVLLSVIPPVLAGVWSWFTHTKSNAVAVVAAMDGPEKQEAFLGVSDALKVVAEGVNRIKQGGDLGVLLITHYTRILKYITPDFVHVFVAGKIAEQGGPELAERLEAEGYDRFLVKG